MAVEAIIMIVRVMCGDEALDFLFPSLFSFMVALFVDETTSYILTKASNSVSSYLGAIHIFKLPTRWAPLPSQPHHSVQLDATWSDSSRKHFVFDTFCMDSQLCFLQAS